jgi:hypothetical protein
LYQALATYAMYGTYKLDVACLDSAVPFVDVMRASHFVFTSNRGGHVSPAAFNNYKKELTMAADGKALPNTRHVAPFYWDGACVHLCRPTHTLRTGMQKSPPQ